MAEARECDRCKKLFKYYRFSRRYEIIKGSVFWKREVDLCKNCYEDFIEWLLQSKESPIIPIITEAEVNEE